MGRSNAAVTLPPEVAAEFQTPGHEDAANELGLAQNHRYMSLRFELAALPNGNTTNRPLTLECYLPAKRTNPPVIMILPMLGGTYPLERYFARYFARHGLASVIVHREKIKAEPDSADGLNELFRATIFDNKRAIDWLQTRPEFDASRIGVFGVSLGAIKAALLTPLEPRVDATVLAMPAGDLPYILTYTTERGIARRRKEILASREFTEEMLRAHLQIKMTCDPMRYAPYVDPKKVLMVLAAWDSTVPVKKGLELRRAMHKPETIVVASGHYTAALYLPCLQWQTVRFFKKRLN
ncbi:MAG: alpha/beta hydrolase [Verrucomicrobia subdivision 3 bacterium]|nr:alpha/beta hydrolase [Limisphaerales bacterium]